MKVEYFEVLTTCTSKDYNAKQELYSVFDQHVKTFKTIEEVQTYLKKTYGKCKRKRSYRDTKTGSEHTGYVYCFNSEDISCRRFRHKWRQQDWVEVYRCVSEPVLVTVL